MAGLNFNITDQNLADILCIAFEGGINYWCSGSVKVKDNDFKGADYASDALPKGAVLYIPDMDEGDMELTKEKLIAGVEKYVNEHDADIIDLATKEIDCCHVDAEVADMMVQLAVHGEVVYG